MKKLTKLNLDELAKRMPIMNQREQKKCIGGNTVQISVNRSYYGDNSTMSYFMATAYDDTGKVVSAITGMFLEPGTDYDKCEVAGSNTAIKYGTYNVVRSTYHGQSGYYEIAGVNGRFGIKIHAGNHGGNTKGCLLPGVTGIYNPNTGESTVSDSGTELKILTKFLDTYGTDGITMNVSI